MEIVTREEVRNMMRKNPETPVVDVLDTKHYDQYHLPGAINIPLGGSFEESIQEAVSDKTKPVIVYCMDENCDTSPKAAERMENLGYQAVYDYAAGKEDWKDAGLSTERG